MCTQSLYLFISCKFIQTKLKCINLIWLCLDSFQWRTCIIPQTHRLVINYWYLVTKKQTPTKKKNLRNRYRIHPSIFNFFFFLSTITQMNNKCLWNMPLKCKQHTPIHAYKHHPYINTHKHTFFLLNPFKSESRIHIDINIWGITHLNLYSNQKHHP